MKKIIYYKSNREIWKHFIFGELVCLFISCGMYFIQNKEGVEYPVKYRYHDFTTILFFINIIFLGVFIFVKRTSAIFVDEKVVYIFTTRFLFIKTKIICPTKNLNISYEYEMTGRGTKSKILRFYNNENLIYQESVFDQFNETKVNNMISVLKTYIPNV